MQNAVWQHPDEFDWFYLPIPVVPFAATEPILIHQDAIEQGFAVPFFRSANLLGEVPDQMGRGRAEYARRRVLLHEFDE